MLKTFTLQGDNPAQMKEAVEKITAYLRENTPEGVVSKQLLPNSWSIQAYVTEAQTIEVEKMAQAHDLKITISR
ncbi:MAG: hypothetical protein C4584_02695 [Armatimonadetes bacterium]|nr:MAG: hypothetical protein C4584_02695 [Armatimonadota bacterium]